MTGSVDQRRRDLASPPLPSLLDRIPEKEAVERLLFQAIEAQSWEDTTCLQGLVKDLAWTVSLYRAACESATAENARLTAELAEVTELANVLGTKYRRLVLETGPAIIARAEAAEARVAELEARLKGQTSPADAKRARALTDGGQP